MNILIIHPMDPSGNSMGGVSTYLRDFLKFLPDVFSVKWIGITSGKKARPKGRWGVINCGRLKIEFLPVLGVKDENEKSAIPLLLKLRALGAKGL